MFQPNYKLKTKYRKRVHVQKTYHDLKSPYERLLYFPGISEETKSRLQQHFLTLDPIGLLHGIRQAQSNLVSHSLNKNHSYGFKSDSDITKTVSIYSCVI